MGGHPGGDQRPGIRRRRLPRTQTDRQ
jgi:hypothetical protein